MKNSLLHVACHDYLVSKVSFQIFGSPDLGLPKQRGGVQVPSAANLGAGADLGADPGRCLVRKDGG